MRILNSKVRASRKGPADWFTGNVWVDEIAVNPEPSRLRAFRVSLEPGARTAWHTHPVGQTLRHWHGAAPGNTMVHLALQGDGRKGC